MEPSWVFKDMPNGEGRCVVASKELNHGQVISQEYPFFYGRSDNKQQEEVPSCLGCCRSSKDIKYYCSQCGWPMCGPRCEKIEQHANYECTYLKRNKIKYPKKQLHILRMKFLHKSIQCFRALLTRKRSPKRFEEFMKLPAQSIEEKATKTHDKFVVKLLREMFRADSLISSKSPENFDFDQEISKIIDRLCLYGFINDECQVELVYYEAASVTRSCCPNLVWSIGPAPDFILQLTAARSIKKNEKLMLPLRHDLYSLGTLKRQEYVLSMTGSPCKCSRCKDPSERMTYLSAVKCSQCESSYLLPKDPSKSKSDALLVCMDGAYCKKIRALKLYDQVDEIYSNSLNLIASIANSEVGTIMLEEEIKKLREDDFLHPNHYIIFRLVWHLVRRKIHQLGSFDYDGTNEFLDHCQFLLRIEESLNPILSRERAELYFYMGRAFLRQFDFHRPYLCSDSPEESKIILDKIMDLYALAKTYFSLTGGKDLRLVTTDMYEILLYIKNLEK